MGQTFVVPFSRRRLQTVLQSHNKETTHFTFRFYIIYFESLSLDLSLRPFSHESFSTDQLYLMVQYKNLTKQEQ